MASTYTRTLIENDSGVPFRETKSVRIKQPNGNWHHLDGRDRPAPTHTMRGGVMKQISGEWYPEWAAGKERRWVNQQQEWRLLDSMMPMYDYGERSFDMSKPYRIQIPKREDHPNRFCNVVIMQYEEIGLISSPYAYSRWSVSGHDLATVDRTPIFNVDNKTKEMRFLLHMVSGVQAGTTLDVVMDWTKNSDQRLPFGKSKYRLLIIFPNGHKLSVQRSLHISNNEVATPQGQTAVPLGGGHHITQYVMAGMCEVENHPAWPASANRLLFDGKNPHNQPCLLSAEADGQGRLIRSFDFWRPQASQNLEVSYDLGAAGRHAYACSYILDFNSKNDTTVTRTGDFNADHPNLYIPVSTAAQTGGTATTGPAPGTHSNAVTRPTNLPTQRIPYRFTYQFGDALNPNAYFGTYQGTLVWDPNKGQFSGSVGLSSDLWRMHGALSQITIGPGGAGNPGNAVTVASTQLMIGNVDRTGTFQPTLRQDDQHTMVLFPRSTERGQIQAASNASQVIISFVFTTI